jgi:preprotein translocase subunit SecE
LAVQEPAALADLPDADAVPVEPVNLASVKYVHAAFFGTTIVFAFLVHKFAGAAWNYLAEWAPAVRAVPWLVRFPEDERETLTLGLGAVFGILGVIQAYRRESIRQFAEEVARELSKVTWPSREAVTNGTLVVILASAIATVYVAVLDRLWGFLTTLVYGA